MIERHAFWSSLASRRGGYADTPEKIKALERWNEVIAMDRLHMTRSEYRSSEQDWIDDALTILNICDHYASQSNNVGK